MKALKKILSALPALAILCILVVPAAAPAEDGVISGQQGGGSGSAYGEGIKGGTTTFQKHLILPAEANVPNATFSFTIVSGRSAEATATTLEITAGPEGAEVGTATFTPTSETKTGIPTDTSISGKKYASATVTVSLTKVSFPAPGVYRYVISENVTGLDAAFSTDEVPQYLDVYVANSAAASATNHLEIKGYVLHSDESAPLNTGGEPAIKSDGFTNEYAAQNLTFSKTVTGNQGSRDKYFKFTVSITGAAAGAKYDVDLTNADAAVPESVSTKSEYIGKSNAASIEIPAGATGTEAVYYLKNGQSLTIKGLAKGTGYTITEEYEDYTQTVEGTANGTIGTEDITVAYTNNRGGAVPTGVMLTIVPGVIIVGIAIVGLIVFSRKKKENE